MESNPSFLAVIGSSAWTWGFHGISPCKIIKTKIDPMSKQDQNQCINSFLDEEGKKKSWFYFWRVSEDAGLHPPHPPLTPYPVFSSHWIPYKIILPTFFLLFELVLVHLLLPYSEGHLNPSAWHNQCSSLCVTSCPIYVCPSHDKGLPDGTWW